MLRSGSAEFSADFFFAKNKVATYAVCNDVKASDCTTFKTLTLSRSFQKGREMGGKGEGGSSTIVTPRGGRCEEVTEEQFLCTPTFMVNVLHKNIYQFLSGLCLLMGLSFQINMIICNIL